MAIGRRLVSLRSIEKALLKLKTGRIQNLKLQNRNATRDYKISKPPCNLTAGLPKLSQPSVLFFRLFSLFRRFDHIANYRIRDRSVT
jgi:hypothetical protein